MRKRKKKKTILPRLLPFVALALATVSGLNYLLAYSDIMEAAGERAAVFSAAVNMPQGGIILLEEEFRDRLYLPPAENGGEASQPAISVETTIPAIHTPMPAPLPPQQDETPPASTEPSPRRLSPRIPEQYRATLLSEDFSICEPSSGHVAFGAGFIKNDTRLTDEKVEEILSAPLNLNLSNETGPTVLIVHTHATEAFERYDSDVYDTRNTWRSQDNNSNIVAIGAVMAQTLEDRGIWVIHDTTQHDFPSYNGSYERSAKTIKSYLEKYPTIRIVLDLHRDAMERDNQVIVKPVTTINDTQAAQIMIIAACDNGNMNIPNYPQNLRFAAHFQSYMEAANPGLTRPVFFTYRKYNMDLSPGSLLVEFGSNANTLEEAAYSAMLAGEALADLILDSM